MNMLIIYLLQFYHVHFLLVPNSKTLLNVSDQKIPQANVTTAHPSFFLINNTQQACFQGILKHRVLDKTL